MITEKNNSNFESDRAELEKLMKDWGTALISNDAKLISRFTTPDWVIVGPSGPTENKQFLAVVESGDLTHDSFSFEMTMLRIYGDAALVMGRVKNTGQFKGEPFTADEWASDVFIRSGGEWLCSFSQITPAVEAAC